MDPIDYKGLKKSMNEQHPYLKLAHDLIWALNKGAIELCDKLEQSGKTTEAKELRDAIAGNGPDLIDGVEHKYLLMEKYVLEFLNKYPDLFGRNERNWLKIYANCCHNYVTLWFMPRVVL